MANFRDTILNHFSKTSSKSEVKEATISSFLESDDDEPITTDMLVEASRKVLNVNRGVEDTDDRDSLAYKKIMSVNDLIGERIRMDAGKTGLNMMRKLNNRRSLKNVPAGIFDGYVKHHIVANPLSQAAEGINPLHLLEQMRRITVFGQGGLASSNVLTEEMTNVHPSIFGYLSTVETSESEKAGVDVRAASGSKLGSDGRIYQRFLNPRTSQYHWLSARDTQDKNIGFSEEFS